MLRGKAIFAFLPVFSLVFLTEGCAVFNPIGEVISSGYENMLTYFNAYYNARRAFKLAETEIAEANKAAEGKTASGATAPPIPAEAQKNLDLVIDKCSNILAYHGKSAYVDEALMMTGKAFYYKGDYSKAERKFLELITQYPNSSLNLDAQYWYASSEEKLGEYDQARNSASTLAASAEQNDDADILAEANSLLGLLSVHDGATVAAIGFYKKSCTVAESNQLKADSWFSLGKLYFDDGQFENAISALLNVDGYSDDVYQIFQSKLLATQAYRNLGLLDKALTIERDMADDYRFKDFLGTVYLERATILLAGKRYSEALDIFQALDTTYARTEVGATADVELGKYYERTAADYLKSKDYYSRAAAVPATPVQERAIRKENAFNHYFTDMKEISRVDSLIGLVSKNDSETSANDSLSSAAKDSSGSLKDSTKARVQAPSIHLSADSLNTIESRAAARIGELFYTDLANPDSAIFWLRYSLLHRYDEDNAPRILYMLSELASTYPDKTTVTSKQYQDQLVRDFPKSYFAGQLQHQPSDEKADTQAIDSAVIYYGTADGLIDAGKNQEALAALQGIVERYPSSPIIPKCRYAIGWLYENRLSMMDSAAAEYKMLIAQYPATPYAHAVRDRQLDTLAQAPAPIDTTTHQPKARPQTQDSVRVGESGVLNSKHAGSKPPGTLSRRARILQSLHHKPSERE